MTDSRHFVCDPRWNLAPCDATEGADRCDRPAGHDNDHMVFAPRTFELVRRWPRHRTASPIAA